MADGRPVAFGFGVEDFGPDEDGEPHGGYDLDEIARQVRAGGDAVTRAKPVVEHGQLMSG